MGLRRCHHLNAAGGFCSFIYICGVVSSPWALSLPQNLWQPPAKWKTSRSPLFYSSIKWLLQLPEFSLNQIAIKVTGWLIKLHQSFQHKGFSPRSPFPAALRLCSKTKHPVDMARNVFIASWPRHPGPIVLNLPVPSHPSYIREMFHLSQVRRRREQTRLCCPLLLVVRKAI